MKTVIAFLILTSGLVAADNYERSRQCAADAERHAAKNKIGLVEWHLIRAHYSPKYQRCFALEAEQENVWTQMVDVYDSTTMADEFIGTTETRCAIWSEPKPCSEVYAFIKERMNH